MNTLELVPADQVAAYRGTTREEVSRIARQLKVEILYPFSEPPTGTDQPSLWDTDGYYPWESLPALLGRPYPFRTTPAATPAVKRGRKAAPKPAEPTAAVKEPVTEPAAKPAPSKPRTARKATRKTAEPPAAESSSATTEDGSAAAVTKLVTEPAPNTARKRSKRTTQPPAVVTEPPALQLIQGGGEYVPSIDPEIEAHEMAEGHNLAELRKMCRDLEVSEEGRTKLALAFRIVKTRNRQRANGNGNGNGNGAATPPPFSDGPAQ